MFFQSPDEDSGLSGGPVQIAVTSSQGVPFFPLGVKFSVKRVRLLNYASPSTEKPLPGYVLAPDAGAKVEPFAVEIELFPLMPSVFMSGLC